MDPTKARGVLVAKADDFAAGMGPIALRVREAGQSLREIAAELTERDIMTAHGGQWTATAVRNVLARIQPSAA